MSAELLVLLAGEGKNDLGSRAGHPAYQGDAFPGVLEALLRRVKADGWRIHGARTWKSVRKLRSGRSEHADTHNVMALALDARESGCHVLAFVRDRDNDDARPDAIAEGIRTAEEQGKLEIVGTVAIPKLEGWILALRGHHRTEGMSAAGAETALAKDGIVEKDTAAMVKSVEDADLAALPSDAATLRMWLGRAERALSRTTKE